MSPWPTISASAAVIVLGIIGGCAPESEDSPSQSPEQVSVEEVVDMLPARTIQLLCSERQVLGDTRTFALFKKGYGEVEAGSGVPAAKAIYDEILTRCHR